MNLQSLQQLLDAEMDRKEFLMYLGASVLAVAGVSGLIRSVTAPIAKQSKPVERRIGYGESPYGG